MKLKFAVAVALAVYAVAEASWLTLTSPFYARRFAAFAKDSRLSLRSVPAAIAVYAVLIATFWVLVAAPIAKQQPRASPAQAALGGAAFGLAVYGVYNLTNKATLPGYAWSMVAVDTAWGTGLFASLAAVFAAALQRT